MKYLPTVASILIGLVFLMASVTFFLGMVPEQQPPDGPMKAFGEAFGPTGYFHFIKAVELIGAILILIPRTRNYGLLALGPVTINILAFHVFVAKGTQLAGAGLVMTAIIVLGQLYLLWVGRQKFAALAN